MILNANKYNYILKINNFSIPKNLMTSKSQFPKLKNR